MKRSDAELGQPMRQSYAAIILITYRLYKVLFRQFFPLIIIFFLGGSIGKKGNLFYMIISIAILGFIYSVIAFFKYFFFLKNDKLIVHKGVFKRSVLEIPFDRIQSINFEQNLIHRLFGVVKLNMDTAGSSTTELQLNALDRGLAKQISDHILSNKTTESVATIDDEVTTHHEEKKVIFHLTIPQLLKVGVTANHLRSAGLIIFFFVWIWDNVRELGMDIEEKIKEEIPNSIDLLQSSLVLFTILIILFVITAFLISLIRTVLKFYNLHMYRKGEGFIIESGLLSRKEQAAKDEKIQLLSWSQNLLQKLSSIYELRMKQASSVAVSDKGSIHVAGLHESDIHLTRKYLFKANEHEFDEMELYGVDKYFRFRRFYYWTLCLIPVCCFFGYNEKWSLLSGFIVLYIIGMIGSHLAFVKKKYAVTENLIIIMGGVWGHHATVMLTHKIQNIAMIASPFQRRRGLASLTIFTASGSITIPDIPEVICLKLKNQFLYSVENSTLAWM